MVENCGMDSEKLYFSTEEIPEQAGYYSLFIIKDESETQRKDRRKELKSKRLRKRKERERWSHLLEQVRVQKI